MRTVSPAVVTLSLLLGLAGCATTGASGGPSASSAAPAKSLFDRLGGKPAITAAVDLMVTNIGNDARINARFLNADGARLKQMLIEQVCEATGGPCKYTGKDMRSAHAGQKISDDEFNALVGDLKAALDQLKVPAQEQSELLSALGGMRKDIVGQ
jgi:hemoglobin